MRRMLIRRPAVGPLTGARMPTGYRSASRHSAESSAFDPRSPE